MVFRAITKALGSQNLVFIFNAKLRWKSEINPIVQKRLTKQFGHNGWESGNLR